MRNTLKKKSSIDQHTLYESNAMGMRSNDNVDL
jgi:hypothetical protein